MKWRRDPTPLVSGGHPGEALAACIVRLRAELDEAERVLIEQGVPVVDERIDLADVRARVQALEDRVSVIESQGGPT